MLPIVWTLLAAARPAGGSSAAGTVTDADRESACRSVFRMFDALADEEAAVTYYRNGTPPVAQSSGVYCLRWPGGGEWRALPHTAADGHWGTARPCAGYWVNYFQPVAPGNRPDAAYTRCKLRQWRSQCAQLFGGRRAHWLVQPAQDDFNEWSAFLIAKERADALLAPAAVTLHRNAHFLSRTVAFDAEWLLSNLTESAAARPC